MRDVVDPKFHILSGFGHLTPYCLCPRNEEGSTKPEKKEKGAASDSFVIWPGESFLAELAVACPIKSQRASGSTGSRFHGLRDALRADTFCLGPGLSNFNARNMSCQCLSLRVHVPK